MTAMKARMKAAMAVAPPKAMQAKKAKKEEQWMKKNFGRRKRMHTLRQGLSRKW